MYRGNLFEAALTEEPLDPVLGDVKAGGDFSPGQMKNPSISLFYCPDGSCAELRSSSFAREETLQLLQHTWALLQFT